VIFAQELLIISVIPFCIRFMPSSDAQCGAMVSKSIGDFFKVNSFFYDWLCREKLFGRTLDLSAQLGNMA
jgi:hypothetical protein